MKKKPKQPVYMNPAAKLPDFDFGVLRADFDGRPNSIATLAQEKSRVATRDLLPVFRPLIT